MMEWVVFIFLIFFGLVFIRIVRLLEDIRRELQAKRYVD